MSVQSSVEASRSSPSEATGTSPTIGEDWLSVGIGLLVVALALVSLFGTDLIGWVVSTAVWTDPALALGTTSKAFAALGGPGALIVTYLALLGVLSFGAALLKVNVLRFAVAFSVVFWIAYASWIAGSYANLAAVPRSSSEVARLSRPTAVTARKAPRMTIAILM